MNHIKKMGWRVLVAVVLFSVPARAEAPPPAMAPIATALERFAEHEREDKGIPGLDIALVDDQQVVWSTALGWADLDKTEPLTVGAVHRVGSISKLFTDIAVMQLVEKGLLDLDAPVARYLRDFKPENPFGGAITLRMLMAHRSGLVREPPVGNYFDPRPRTLAETVRSLNTTTLVYRPGQRTKYSNAGIAVVGRVLEHRQRERFAGYVKRAVLEPLGLRSSAFTPEPALAPRVPDAFMWTYDPRVFPVPRFELGMAPAGSLYATVGDLGRFLSFLFAGGRGPRGPVLKPETLEKMWTPAFPAEGAGPAYGLGFRLSSFAGHRLVGHAGAIYGFASSLLALPDDKLGVVVVGTKDGANAVTDRIARQALALLLAAREKRPLPEGETTVAVERSRARSLAGLYVSGDAWVELEERGGELHLAQSDVAQRLRLRARAGGADLVVDDVLDYGLSVVPEGDGLRIGDRVYTRAAATLPAPPPAAFSGLVGEYGWDHETLYILERRGRLEALIEWFDSYPLKEVAPDVFRFPETGLYRGESLRFTRDASGRASLVSLNGIEFPRRASGVEAGIFRVTPLRPVPDLVAESLRARPPAEAGDRAPSDLVDLSRLDPAIKLDVRYATTDNFLGVPVYAGQRAFLQRPAAEALVRAHRRLGEQGYGLLIHDAYRPWYVTRVFWEATPEDKHVFVANPAQGSRHNRGCAVDLTLYRKADGEPVQMTGVYDEMSERSYPDFPGGTSEERSLRYVLRRAMEDEGFSVYEAEWWHFDYRDWPRYAIQNLTFEQLDAER
jgi:CubicO group peptidase (beta-lactamase class C family)/D-alanyl-D-alanine dipeptidase